MRRREISLGLGREGPRPRVNETETETKKNGQDPPACGLARRCCCRIGWIDGRSSRRFVGVGRALNSNNPICFFLSLRLVRFPPVPGGSRGRPWPGLCLRACLPCGAVRRASEAAGRGRPHPTRQPVCDAKCLLLRACWGDRMNG
jgi:hypothetical protein